MTGPGVALEGRNGKAYNEDAFRYFLEVERARVGRGRRGSRLLLVQFTSSGRPPGAQEPSHVEHLLAGLLRAVRDTDIVGWFREGVVAGAILTDRADAGEESAAAGLQRIRRTLQAALPAGLDGRIRIRTAALTARLEKGRRA